MHPQSFRVVSRTANTATFAWVAPAAGIVPDGYVIEGGFAGQTQVLASVPTGGAATQVTLAVPNGLFFVRVVAQRGTIRLGQSADLQLAVYAGAFPAAPANLLGSAAGQQLTLSWVNPLNGGASTGMRIDVSGSITTAIDLPVTEQFAFDGVPPGTYTFAVTSLINSVPGDASNVVTLTFPGTCSRAARDAEGVQRQHPGRPDLPRLAAADVRGRGDALRRARDGSVHRKLPADCPHVLRTGAAGQLHREHRVGRTVRHERADGGADGRRARNRGSDSRVRTWSHRSSPGQQHHARLGLCWPPGSRHLAIRGDPMPASRSALPLVALFVPSSPPRPAPSRAVA